MENIYFGTKNIIPIIGVKVITALIIGIQKIVSRLITLIGDLQIQFHTNGQKLICRRLSEYGV